MPTTSPPPAPSMRQALYVFAAALLLYVIGVAPDMLWGDSAEFQIRTARYTFSADTRGYPLYSTLLWLFGHLPFGTYALKASLFSALTGAAAVGLMFAVLRRLGCSLLPALVATAGFAVSHTFWQHTAIAEVYTLHILFVASITYLVVSTERLTPGRLLGAGLLIGLALTHHITTLFLLPACLVFLALRARDLPRSLVSAGALAGSLTLMVAPLLFVHTLDLYLGGDGFDLPGGGGGGPSLVARIADFVKYLVFNFPSPLLLFAPIGLWRLARRPVEAAAAFIVTALLVQMLAPMVTRWHGDQYVFFLPAFFFTALLAGPGIQYAVSRLPEHGFVRGALNAVLLLVVLLPPAAYVTLGLWLSQPGAPDPLQVSRSHYRSYFMPPKFGYREPRRYTEHLMDTLPPDAVLLCDTGVTMALKYLQEIEGRRTDLQVVLAESERVMAYVIERTDGNLYAASIPHYPEPWFAKFVPDGYRIQEDGRSHVYQIVAE